MNDNMPETVKLAVSQFSRELKRMLGERLVRVVLYGSYARGTYHDNSDVDIMVLVNMLEDEIRRIKNSIYDLAFEIEMNTGIDIAPIIKEKKQYEYWVDTLPFYRNVRDEGICNEEKQPITHRQRMWYNP